MQTDAKTEAPRVRRTFHPTVKERALKALLDYSRLTRRRWTLILKEILELVGETGGKFESIVRQDLESWGRGDSELGDAKFSYVYDFLTHPLTAQRPEFRGLKLGEPIPSFIVRGQELVALFGGNVFRLKGKGRHWNDPRDGEDRYAGTYIGRDGWRSTPVAMKISEVNGEEFSLFHLLLLDSDVSTEENWNAIRISGYLVGDAVLIGREPGGTAFRPNYISQLDPEIAGIWHPHHVHDPQVVAMASAPEGAEMVKYLSMYSLTLSKTNDPRYSHIFDIVDQDLQ